MTGRHLADVMTDVVKDRVADPQWLGDARWQVAQNPDAIAMLFPAVGRRCGRGPLADAGPELADWSVDDAARVLLLTALPLRGAALARQVAALYWQGARRRSGRYCARCRGRVSGSVRWICRITQAPGPVRGSCRRASISGTPPWSCCTTRSVPTTRGSSPPRSGPPPVGSMTGCGGRPYSSACSWRYR